MGMMPKLPNAARAIVPQPKITRYLLDLTSEGGRSKAEFFLGFGFTIEGWQVMADALRGHAMAHEVASTRETPYGVNYAVEGALVTPDGRNPQVRSVWKVTTDHNVPSLVSAYPLRT